MPLTKQWRMTKQWRLVLVAKQKFYSLIGKLSLIEKKNVLYYYGRISGYPNEAIEADEVKEVCST